MAGKIETFTKRMQAIFGPAYKDASGEVIGILAKSLQHFSDEVLNSVVDRFALTREYKTWPMPVEIIAACKAEEKKRLPPPKPKPNPNDKWSDFNLSKADRLIQCELGIEAAEGGWLDALWNFCREHERLPDGAEIDKVMARAEKDFRTIDKALDKITDDTRWGNKSTGLRNSLANLAEKMQMASKRRYDMVMRCKKVA